LVKLLSQERVKKVAGNVYRIDRQRYLTTEFTEVTEGRLEMGVKDKRGIISRKGAKER